MDYSRIFITGATGRVGGALIKQLRGKCEIVAASQRAMQTTKDVEWIEFSFENEDSFDAALRGVDAIFLMRPPQITKPEIFRPFLNAAKARGIKRVVVLSVLGAADNSFLPHHKLEKLVQEMGFAWTMIRPSDFMQNLETVHRNDILERREISVPAGDGKSSFIDVDDIAKCIEVALCDDVHIGEGFDLTGPQALSLFEVADKLSVAAGKAINYRPAPIIGFIWRKVQSGYPFPLALVMTALYSVQRFGKAATITRKVKELTGNDPATLDDYLQRTKYLWTK
ncbi:NmrA family NAD(P)-binding protein [Maritalea porphyrae]|uniref:NmrA family transcriptional regulator n=1 Tax=Maritalea porphyrae TaxID=880732 RepID=A0ABQ5UUM1_9HYPH|nr:NAD(P)H-binding protein [Maritalea porphyrae]GLQ18050.1 NmrA family transcriptional regulator [Maritalea porphyrae]